MHTATKLKSAMQISGLRHRIYFTNGNQYVGEWLNSKMHGKGTYVWKESHCVFEGEWADGQRSGHGILSCLEDGRFVRHYVGQWLNDQRHGYGVQIYPPGGYYEGNWVENKRDGLGKQFYGDDSVYEGEWRNDERNGHGTIIYANGNMYEGRWANDKKHGPGTYVYTAKELKLSAEWVNDVPKQGVFTSAH